MEEQNKNNIPKIDSTTKNFIKEVKRIKWPRITKVWKWFVITITFLIIM